MRYWLLKSLKNLGFVSIAVLGVGLGGRALGETMPTETPPASPTISPSASPTLPLAQLDIGNQSAIIPDWKLITFANFPRFLAAGEWGDLEWAAGDSITEVLSLGDFQGSLDLQLLSVSSISQRLGLLSVRGKRLNIMEQIPLSEFALLEQQSFGSLVLAVPGLLDLKVADVAPIQALIRSVDPMISEDTTVEEVLQQRPEYGDISLRNLDLSQYSIADLPGIELAPIQAFEHWQAAAIVDIPFLQHVSLWALPGEINLSGQIAIASIEPGDVGDAGTDKNTAAITLTPTSDDLVPVIWPLGSTHQSVLVEGKGELAHINGGEDLAGATPYGPAFKVVPHAVSSSGIELAAYFRSCRQQEKDAPDCSAYGIGPVPLMTVRPGDRVFLGEFAFELEPVEKDVPAPASRAEFVDESTLFEEVLDTVSDNPRKSGGVAFIFVLVGGFIYWALTGDPIKFAASTGQWLLEKKPRKASK